MPRTKGSKNRPKTNTKLFNPDSREAGDYCISEY